MHLSAVKNDLPRYRGHQKTTSEVLRGIIGDLHNMTC